AAHRRGHRYRLAADAVQRRARPDRPPPLDRRPHGGGRGDRGPVELGPVVETPTRGAALGRGCDRATGRGRGRGEGRPLYDLGRHRGGRGRLGDAPPVERQRRPVLRERAVFPAPQQVRVHRPFISGRGPPRRVSPAPPRGRTAGRPDRPPVPTQPHRNGIDRPGYFTLNCSYERREFISQPPFHL